ncbi:unnamed protein product, partial [Ectocarpus sp. 12 AP-2014]
DILPISRAQHLHSLLSLNNAFLGDTIPWKHLFGHIRYACKPKIHCLPNATTGTFPCPLKRSSLPRKPFFCQWFKLKISRPFPIVVSFNNARSLEDTLLLEALFRHIRNAC